MCVKVIGNDEKNRPTVKNGSNVTYVQIILENKINIRLLFVGRRSKTNDSLFTGTEFDPELVVTELKTMPQILSTQTDGVPI